MKTFTDEMIVLNRELAGSTDGWFQLAPIGEFPGVRVNGKPVVQIIDALSCAEIVRNFKPKLLVDREHWSMEPDGDTEASAWIANVEARDDGVWGLLEFSDVGRLAVQNKRYRFLSPILGLDNPTAARARVIKLLGAGLTNKPNLRGMVPLANKAEEAGKRGPMNNIAKALGLAEGSDEAACLAAITKLQEQAAAAATAKNRLAELEATAMAAEADKFCEDHANVIQNKDQVKDQYIKNKAATIALFGSIKAPAEAAGTVLNRGDGKPPQAQTDADQQKAQNRDAEVGKLIVANKMTHAQAWAHLATTRPELF